MNLIIDRFEGEYAVMELESGTHANMPRVLLPTEAREGDTVSIQIDKQATEGRKQRIGSLMNSLFED